MSATFKGHALISDQISAEQIAVITRELSAVLRQGVAGDVVEFGCYTGTTSLFLRRQLDSEHSDKTLHVYDSFAGLPPKAEQDRSSAGDAFQAGELLASRQALIKHFKQAGLKLPIIHKGWFNQLSQKDVPEQICFAFLDGDFYDSIMDSLKLVWPRLQPGGCVIFDDYRREALPGVERAVRDYFKGHPPAVRTELNMGIVRL